MPYAVLDTNVVVSALLKANSTPSLILEQVFTGKIIPVSNEKILAEYDEVLRRRKFNFPENNISKIINGFLNRGIFCEPAELDYKLIDERDEIFLAVAISSGAFLITDNTKHFPKENFVVTPQEMISFVQQSSRDHS